MTVPELEVAADGLNRVLAALQAGGLTAPAGSIHRIEGAVIALRAVINGAPFDAETILFTENERIV